MNAILGLPKSPWDMPFNQVTKPGNILLPTGITKVLNNQDIFRYRWYLTGLKLDHVTCRAVVDPSEGVRRRDR
jgi:hypothetical protein